ncbi:MAG: hypothetical protein ACRDMU_02685 [Gaiellaceae bacterium]
MRSPAAWLVLGALLVIALLAAVDALRGDSSTPGSGETEDVTTERRPETARGPPTIEGQTAVAAELAASRISGTLYLTDAECRLWTLFLPDLAWRLVNESSPDCRFAVSPLGDNVLVGDAAWDPTGYIGAVEQTTADVGPRIEVSSPLTGWRALFVGSSPAFRPDGTLTFVRDGELWGWVERPCAGARETVAFEARGVVERCARVLVTRGALRRAFRRGFAAVQDPTLGEAVWLDARTVVVLVHGRRAGHGIAVFVDGKVRARRAAFVPQVSDLEASPRGTRVAYRADGAMLFYDRDLRDVGFRADVRAITWPPDQRFTVQATDSSVYLVRPGEPMIQIPVATSDIGWVD